MTVNWLCKLVSLWILLWGVSTPSGAAEYTLPSPYSFSTLSVQNNTITYRSCGVKSDEFPRVLISEQDSMFLEQVANEWGTGLEKNQKQAISLLAKWLDQNDDLNVLQVLAASLTWMHFNLYQYSEAARINDVEFFNSFPRVAAETALILAEIAMLQGNLEQATLQLGKVNNLGLEACPAVYLKYAVLSAELAIEEGRLSDADSLLSEARQIEIVLGAEANVLPLRVNLYDTLSFLYISESRQRPSIKKALLSRALKAEAIALSITELPDSLDNKALIKQRLVVLSNMAWLHTQLFDYHNAEIKLLSALALLQQAPDRDLENHIYHLLGINYFNLGLFEKARVFLLNAAAIAKPSDVGKYARISCLITQIEDELALVDSSSGALGACSALISADTSSPDDKILSLATQIKYSPGDFTQQLALTERLEAEMRLTNHENMRMTGFAALAEFAMETNNRALAERVFNEMQYEEASVTPTLQVKAKLLKYRFLTLKDVNEQALAFADDAHEYIVNVLRKLDTNELAPALQSQVFSFYQLWFEHLMQSNSEANAHKVLHVSIQLNQITNGLAGTGINQSRDGLMQVSDLQAQVLDNNSAKMSLKHHIAWDLERLKYAKANPASLSLRVTSGGSETETIASLQARLKPSEQLLFYVAGVSTGYVFGVMKDTVAFSSIGNLPSLQHELREMHAQLSNRLPYDNQVLTSLAERIFPADLVAPDNSVWYVVSNQVFQDIPVNGLALLLEQQPDAVIKLLSLAKGESSMLDSAKPAFKLLSVPELTLDGSTQVPKWMAELKPLPWSAIEAESVTRLFKETDAQAIVGEQATRDALFSDEVKTASILHIAAHHIYDPFKPQFVGLVLNAGAQDTLGSAFISEYEIRNQVFQNDLVFLNGCATAQGRHFVGSNTMSITRAFLIGGAKRVVSTLWEVADKASLNFASHYYQDYLRTEAPDKALLNTMRKMKNQPRYRHPFYWAGYELTQRHL